MGTLAQIVQLLGSFPMVVEKIEASDWPALISPGIDKDVALAIFFLGDSD